MRLEKLIRALRKTAAQVQAGGKRAEATRFNKVADVLDAYGLGPSKIEDLGKELQARAPKKRAPKKKAAQKKTARPLAELVEGVVAGYRAAQEKAYAKSLREEDLAVLKKTANQPTLPILRQAFQELDLSMPRTKRAAVEFLCESVRESQRRASRW
ncbi:MAG: hypothetical protein AAF555_01515 [Verrucomicrobiota bacterium]